MMPHNASEQFFEAKYAAASDPWQFATNRYELHRYETIISSLQGRRYLRTFEPGCSIGVLTRQLSHLSQAVCAIDISSIAVARAREHCQSLFNLTIRQGTLPDDIPEGWFDLVVFSEIGYYFDGPELTRVGARLLEHLTPGGVFLAAHWLGVSPDHQLSGDEVHACLGAIPGLERTLAERHEGYRIEKWTRIRRTKIGTSVC